MRGPSGRTILSQRLGRALKTRLASSCHGHRGNGINVGMPGMNETRPPNDAAPARARILDIGAGDPEAPANAIPNLIAHLVETETWRNAATVIMGALLIVLGYWAYNGVRESIAQTRVTGLEALLSTVVKGLDVWVGEHMAEAARLAKDPAVVERATRLAAEAQRRGTARNAARARPTISDGRCSRRCPRAGSSPSASSTAPGSCSHRRMPRVAASVCASALSASGSTSRSTACRSSCARIRKRNSRSRSASGRARPVAWFLAPIRGAGGSPVAALAMGVETDRELATIFSAARPGTTAEAYAFSDDGLMLTPIALHRRADRRRRPEGDRSEQLRVPRPCARSGRRSCRRAHSPTLEPAARPLTRAAALAVAARGKTTESEQGGAVVAAVPQLPRPRRHRRVALAAGLRHGCRSPRFPPPRRSRRCATSGSASR